MFVSRASALAIGAAFAALASSAAQADLATDYNLFTLKNLTVQGSDTEGRVAVGGNADLNQYTIGAVLGGGTTNLVVGGNLNQYGWGQITGKIAVGGTSTAQHYIAPNVLPGNSLPVDFSAEGTRLKNLATTLAGQANTGTISSYDGGGNHGLQLTLTGGAAAGVNVFNILASDLARVNTFNVNVTNGSSVLINVTGSNGYFANSGIFLNGTDNNNVLWNFSDATSLSFNSIGIRGSVLAPNADWYQSGWGVIDGQVFIGSYSGSYSGGSVQINNVKYNGGLLAYTPPVVVPPSDAVGDVPEPSSWGMMLAGFAFIGWALRSRRHARVLVA